MTTPPAAPSVVNVTWRGDRRYEVTQGESQPLTIDAAGVAGTGPVNTVMGALAACSSIDVVDILAKQRTPAGALRITVEGTRQASVPRRLTAITLTFDLEGEGVSLAAAERAVSLSLGKYCSVASSLAPDIALSARVIVNGAAGEMQPIAVGTGDAA
jgi:putative redox protein